MSTKQHLLFAISCKQYHKLFANLRSRKYDQKACSRKHVHSFIFSFLWNTYVHYWCISYCIQKKLRFSVYRKCSSFGLVDKKFCWCLSIKYEIFYLWCRPVRGGNVFIIHNNFLNSKHSVLSRIERMVLKAQHECQEQS